MKIIAAVFRERDRVLKAVDALRAAGFAEDAVTVIASPTSAGDVAREAARELERPEGGFVDFGSLVGGQADPGFSEAERRELEARVAQGETFLRVDAPDQAADRAEAILLEAGAELVLPGTIRD